MHEVAVGASVARALVVLAAPGLPEVRHGGVLDLVGMECSVEGKTGMYKANYDYGSTCRDRPA